MKIGLYDIDSKKPNLALMKLSAYHKQQGDHVEFYSPLVHDTYDKIYASKIFMNSNAPYLRTNMIRGGSGFKDTLTKTLPDHIEHIYPDYTLYNCDYAIGFITRGCIRHCPFCIVPEKEGNIRFNAHLEEFTHTQTHVMLLDNNILAYSDHQTLLQELIDSKKKIDFNQGIDIRLITKKNAKLLKEIKIWKQLRFALDTPNLIPLVKKKMDILKEAGFSPSTFFFYILIGYNTTYKEDLKRVQFLRDNYKCTIYPMPYNQSNKYNAYIKDFKRWVSRMFYKYESFEEYCKKSTHTQIQQHTLSKKTSKFKQINSF